MKMEDVRLGHVYVRGYNQGRYGIMASKQRVMVDATYVTTPSRKRSDLVQVHNVSWDAEKEEWNFAGAYDADGKHLCYTLQARELLTIDEVEEQEREKQRQEEIRQRRIEAREAFQAERALALAIRTGVPVEGIDVRVTAEAVPDDDGDFNCVTMRATIQGTHIDAMMEVDPDPLIVEAALEEIPFAEMEASKIAEHIVGALRFKPDVSE
jgi:hypothetical protein